MHALKMLHIPFDYGQDHRGVREGHHQLVHQGLLRRLSDLVGEIEVGDVDLPPRARAPGSGAIKWARQNSRGNRQISDAIAELDLRESFLLNIGGDHGAGLGTVHGILRQRPDTVVVWADAHGDLNTPATSPSRNFHGMALAFLLRAAEDARFSWLTHVLPPEHLILFGARDLDPGETALLRRLGIQYYSSAEINQVGARELLDIALAKADPAGEKSIHLSFDVDLFDAGDMLATGTRVGEGPRQEEVFLIGGALAETGRLRSMDVVEYNPELGGARAAKASGELILDFICCTLGQIPGWPSLAPTAMLESYERLPDFYHQSA